MQRDGGPGGAGGAGNPVGGGFTGPAQALDIYLDHCAAYSGPVEDAGSGSADTTLFKFTTGNYLAVVQFGQYNDSAGGSNIYITVAFNGGIILSADFDTTTYDNGQQPIPLLIPAYTEVEVKWGIDSITETMSAYMVGRIYRGR